MSNELSSAVAVCVASSEFVQVTSVPAFTVTVSGAYLKSAISTLSVDSAPWSWSSWSGPTCGVVGGIGIVRAAAGGASAAPTANSDPRDAGDREPHDLT